MGWTTKKQVDYSPKDKKNIEFTDYTNGDFTVCDYRDSWHVLRKNKYVIRTRTLRNAKQVVRWLSGEEKLPTFKRGERFWRLRRKG